MSGIVIQCVQCGRRFIWSYEQQRDFKARGYDPPKHCPECRSRRRYDRQPGMRGVSGTLQEPLSFADPAARQLSSIPLWKNLPRSDHYRYLSRFMHLSPSAIPSLSAHEIALLAQWMFEQRDIETNSVEEQGGRLDLALTNKRHQWNEFARVYFGKGSVVTNPLLDLLTKLRGTDYKRIYLCTVGAFSKAPDLLESEFPLLVEVLEGERLARRLIESQQTYRDELAQRTRRRTMQVTSPKRTLWSSIRQAILTWLR